MITRITLLAILFTQIAYSQITFEKGYFINLNNEKVECFIKNVDWDNNPTEFSYKLTASTEKQIHSVTSVKEFGIPGKFTYQSEIVEIDKSSDDNNLLSSERNPIFEEKTLFLKLLVNGNIKLLYYKDGNLFRYFFEKDNEIKQLVYKRYNPSGITIKTNGFYKQQISNLLKCNGLTIKNIKSIDYKKQPLMDVFKKYNKCINPSLTYEVIEKKKNLFHLSIKPGVQSSSAQFLNNGGFFSNSEEFNFDSSINFRFGIETEFVLPFNKNKWSIYIEPTYQNFTPENLDSNNNIEYQSIEIPLGLKHYFYTNKSKFFIDGGIVVDVPFNSTYNTRDITGTTSFLVGLGVVFNDKYGLEIRHQTRRQLLSQFINLSLRYSNDIVVIFSYRLF